MHLSLFSHMNAERCNSVTGFNHPVSSWTLSDWMTALAGEVGEAANIIKKLNRIRDGMEATNKIGETESRLRQELAKELADSFCYLDLLATAAGIDFESAIIDKWNEVSERHDCPMRITKGHSHV